MNRGIVIVILATALLWQLAEGQNKPPVMEELRVRSFVFVNNSNEEVARLQTIDGRFQMWVRDPRGKGGILIDGNRLAVSVVGKSGKPAAFLGPDDDGSGIVATFSHQSEGGAFLGVDENGGTVGITNIHGSGVLSVEANQTNGSGRLRIMDSREKPRIALTVVDDNPVLFRIDRDGSELPSLR